MTKILNISGAHISDRGIKKLARYVEANLPDDYTLVIGCKPYVYDVDAVLIGNGNIYAIECKDWIGKVTGGSYGNWQKDGNAIENPLHQARNNTVALAKWLRSHLKLKGSNIWVKGLLVFTHDNCHISMKMHKKSLNGVSVLHLSQLGEWVLRQKRSVKEKVENMVNEWFNDFKGEENMKNKNFIKKILLILTIFTLLAVGFLGFRFFGDPDSVFGPLFLLSGIVLSVLIGIWRTVLRIKAPSGEKGERNDYDPLSDLVEDPLNVYETYDKP